MKTNLLCAAVALACSGPAAAFTFESGGISGSFDSWITLGTGIRAASPGCDTLIGTVGGAASPPSGAGAPAGCIDGLTMVNDQGNLNYKKGSAFTTYLNGTHELLLKFPENWKFFGRANWRADASATHASGYISGDQGVAGSSDSFPAGAASQLRFKARLLDFWVSKDFDAGGERARVRLGNQVISWGESLFLPGGINQTNAMDIMRLSQPGTQLKEVFLPAPILSMASGLGNGFNVEAYVQPQWNANYFPPVGSYWSTATLGAGADAFAPGVFATPTVGKPRNSGQYGVALRYQPAGTQANFGLYAMRYHDKAPVVAYSDPMNGLGAHYTYLEDRTLFGLSASFPLGDWAIGTELSYRPKDAVSLHTLTQNNVDGGFCLPGGNCYIDEKKYQFHLTGILSMTPSDYGGILSALGGADTATLMAEAVVVSYPKLQSSYMGVPVAAGFWSWGFLNANDASFGTPQSVGSRTSWGYNFDFSWTYDGKLIPGWQVTPEIYYFQAVKGRTPNGMALLMEGAKSANFIVTFMQNPASWQVGVNYAKFWGGSSVLDQPLRGRDFFGLYVTRNF
ncbi:MAG: DUF1302 domain-containing protein [Burkholderiales bacterium]|nr:DUF1302 domain-containing protein [Burkholderiales bacterium]